MGGGSKFDDNDFQSPPSTIQPNASIHAPARITQLPGVFIPSCKNGSVIYPTTTQKNQTPQRRVSIVPPAPSTTLNCSLLSHGDDETMDWVPQASPVFRRPSRCMSVGEIGVDSTSSESIEEIVGEAESAGVSGESNKDPRNTMFMHPRLAANHSGQPTVTLPASRLIHALHTMVPKRRIL
ncbi:hypothetical protein LX32DRAFT_117466 [Colletotrichum zoysiae]|uniref:Uncharacterized protein n=1 Tax=Colletotrichum zoysiae TaxID=1216348 RepID=A0AAD9HQ61_9PEZI|nr:hypothetical protein LX32DRAFT_117466 [Colletotrichum zoysiae]